MSLENKPDWQRELEQDALATQALAQRLHEQVTACLTDLNAKQFYVVERRLNAMLEGTALMKQMLGVK